MDFIYQAHEMHNLYQRLFILVFVLSATAAFAGEELLKGKIVDENGLPMPGATIIVDGQEQKGAISNVEGEFTITGLDIGKYKVKITFIGYQEVTQEIEVSQVPVSFNVSMEPGVTLEGEVLVLGDRLKGQAKALNQQRTNDNITNVIAADQIGRFPDANVGDALKRVSGITVQGDQGEARNIVIRGLAPQLNSVTLNGNRIPSAEGDNRNIQMDLIPADMIQSIQVNKAVLPEMDGDAIGGSVNLVTRSASKGLRLSGFAAGSYNEVGETLGYNFGVVVSNRFLDNKLGAVLSTSYRTDNIGSHNAEAEYDIEVENADFDDESPEEGDNIEDVEVDPYIKESEIRTYEVTRTRRSLALNLDYKISLNHTIYAKGMYNWRDDWENRFKFKTEVDGAVFGNGVDQAPTEWVGVAERETKGGVNSDRVKNKRLEDQRVQAYSLNGDHWFGDIQVKWNAAYSKASEERPNERYASFETDEGLRLNPASVFGNFNKPRLISTNPETTSSANYVFDKYEEENQYTEEENYTAQIDLKIPLSVVNGQEGNLKLGVKYNAKSKYRDNDLTEYTLSSGEDFYLNQTTSVNMDNRDFLVGRNFLVGEFYAEEALGDIDFSNEYFEGEDQPFDYLPGNYQADEDVTAAYLQMTQDLNDKIRVIAGARFEHTDFEYTGNVFDSEEEFINQVKDSKSYDNFLPALHLRYAVNSDLIVRAAWTNTLARPNYYDLVPYSFIEDEEDIFLGNPNLNPSTSMNFDLMSEYYFQSVGLLSLGVFHKEIDDFVYTSSSQNELGGNTFVPQNTGKGGITGIEVSAQRQLDFLPGIWKGIGLYVNYTYNYSDVAGIANEDGEVRDGLDLPGTADHLFNASISFETEKFVLRVSTNYSSDYIDEIGDDEFYDRYYDEQFFLDINASYAVTNNWRAFAEANNLTNQPLRYYQGVESRTMQVEYYGPKFNLGVKFDLFQN